MKTLYQLAKENKTNVSLLYDYDTKTFSISIDKLWIKREIGSCRQSGNGKTILEAQKSYINIIKGETGYIDTQVWINDPFTPIYFDIPVDIAPDEITS